jgi:ABC-2 type transport system permease protein
LASNYPFLLRELVRRDFQSRYAGSVLGATWSLLQPLWQLALFTFVFSSVLKMEVQDARTTSFAFFLFCALVPFLAVQEGIFRSATAITENSELVKKLRFPPELLVISAVLGGLLQSLFGLAILFVSLIVFSQLSWSTLPWLVVVVPLQLGLTLGLGLTCAALQVFVRDLAQVLQFLLTTWFYLTPIVYSFKLVPAWLRQLVEINPMFAIVEIYRTAFLGPGEPPSPTAITALAISCGAALAIGFTLFRLLRPAFADEV